MSITFGRLTLLWLALTIILESANAQTASSIYQTDVQWTTQHDDGLRLKDLAGQVVVTTMIFTSCTYACPQIIADFRKIAASLPPHVERNIKFVFITMDVKRDKPAVLRAFATKMGVDKENWVFLHGDADDTREFAALLGIKYKRMRDGSFSHSNIITVLNKRGEIVHQQVGLNAEHSPTVTAIMNEYETSGHVAP